MQEVPSDIPTNFFDDLVSVYFKKTCIEIVKISGCSMSTDGVHFRFKVEDAALVALFMVHEAVFEADFSLSIKDVVLGLSTRSDGF